MHLWPYARFSAVQRGGGHGPCGPMVYTPVQFTLPQNMLMDSGGNPRRRRAVSVNSRGSSQSLHHIIINHHNGFVHNAYHTRKQQVLQYMDELSKWHA